MKTCIALFSGTFLAILAVGCTQPSSSPEPAASATPASASAEGEKYLLNAEPEGASDVIGVRESADKDDDVVIVGRIGGAANPWIDGRASFTIVDPSIKACSDIPGDSCPTPWDYCCETTKLKTATALVKIVDENGGLVQTDARELLALKELQTVVVEGKASRDESGNLTVLATGIFVRK